MDLNQLTEEPEMGTFVDVRCDRVSAALVRMLEELKAAIGVLEDGGHQYAPAARMMLAGEAALEHAIGKLTEVRNVRQRTWQEHQREAHEYLVLRAGGSGRTFRVREAMTNMLPIDTWFSFTILRAPALDGRLAAKVARLQSIPDGDLVTTLPLQRLHRAFLLNVVEEVLADEPALQTGGPRSGPTGSRTPTP